MLTPLALYIHVPFCNQRCDYCHFYVVTGLEKLIPEYVAALQHEIELLAEQLNFFEISTIYFGGGTPSLLSGEQVAEILKCCQQKLHLKTDCEISLEANPESLNLAKLQKYLTAGVNRLSLGLQAGQNFQLKSLGRTYTVAEFNTAAKMAKAAGVKNLNLDLIFGLPNQTLAEWEQTLDLALSHQPQHLACYSLELDHQSVFGQKFRRGQLQPASDQLNREFYQTAKTKLSQTGFKHYELSNWAQPGFECRHNLNFWQNLPYIGIGAGAQSYFKHQTWQNLPIVRKYLEKIQANQLAKKEVAEILPTDYQAESIILGLRIIAGINLKKFAEIHHFNPLELFPRLWPKLIAKKLVKISTDHICLTELGHSFYDQVAVMIWQQI